MGKIWVEICLVSARGLRRTSSLWKLQWFAVGWINPNNKYCTKIDSSGNANPVWKTKFSALIDSSDSNFKDLAIHVEVYSREPIFLRERLQGTATVVLKEFLDKYNKDSEVLKPVEEVGSFQLRKRNSNKPQGFVDVSIRISEEKEEPSSYPGDEEGFKLMDHNNGINFTPRRRPENHPHMNSSYGHPVPFSTSYPSSAVAGPSNPLGGGAIYQPPQTPPVPPGSSYSSAGHGYQPARTPPPPPPPSNVGYIPTLLPRTNNLPPSFINMPSSGVAPGRNNGAAIGMGLGAGALAAGAVIFGDDFMSGFDLPGSLQDASLTISTNPPF